MDKLLASIVEAAQNRKAKNIISLDLQQLDGAICSHSVMLTQRHR